MDVKLMHGKLFGAQVLESYNTEVSCGQGIKVLSFQGVVEPVIARWIGQGLQGWRTFLTCSGLAKYSLIYY
jgi:hypothetical protein